MAVTDAVALTHVAVPRMGVSGVPTVVTTPDGALGTESFLFLSELNAITVNELAWFLGNANVACRPDAIVWQVPGACTRHTW